MKQGLKTAAVVAFTYAVVNFISPFSTTAQTSKQMPQVKIPASEFVVRIPLSDSLGADSIMVLPTPPAFKQTKAFSRQSISPDAVKFFTRAGLQSNLQNALADLDSALLLSPSYVDALYLKGRLLYQAGRNDEALKCYMDADMLQMFSGALEDFMAYADLLLRADKPTFAWLILEQGTAYAAMELFKLNKDIANSTSIEQLLDLESKRAEIEGAASKLQMQLGALGYDSE